MTTGIPSSLMPIWEIHILGEFTFIFEGKNEERSITIKKVKETTQTKDVKLLSLEFCRAPHWWHQYTPNSVIFKEKVSGGSVVKNPAANAGDLGWIPGLGRSPGEEDGNPLQYSCLGNPMNREAWQATVHMVTKSWTLLEQQQHFS